MSHERSGGRDLRNGVPISDQTASTRPWALAVLAAAYGATAVGLPYLVTDLAPSLPNTVAGGTLLTCGLLLLDGGDRELGTLVGLGGVAWFAPDLAPALTGPLRSGFEASSLLYVGFLTQASVMVGDRALARPLSRLATVIGYVVALTAATSLAEPALLVLGLVLTLVAVLGLGTGWWGPACTMVLAVGFLVPTGVRLASGSVTEPTLDRVVLLAVTSVAVLCAAASQGPRGSRAAITLGADASAALAAEIGDLSGQGPVDVVFPSPDGGTWVDLSGLPTPVTDADLFVLGEPGAPLAGLRERITIPGLVADDLAHLLRLAREHARLNLLVRRRSAAIETSHRRLVASGDDERRRLETALRQGAGATLEEAVRAISGSSDLIQLRARARTTLAGLESIARGIDPLGDRGLRAGLADLAARAGVPVSVSVPHEPPDPVARTIWFACSEAVANVEKHAPHARAWIAVEGDADPVRVAISDDGPGGADPDGRGLRGLADRALALGGRLVVTSDVHGTRIELTLPRPERPA